MKKFINKKQGKVILTAIIAGLLAVFLGDDWQAKSGEGSQWYGGESSHSSLGQGISNEKAESATVKYVVDGDTVVLTDGRKVRLLGIDTPERGKYLYEEATDKLKSLVDHKQITLRSDISQTDRYGRLLRHIYVGDMWVNEVMIRDGYARMVTFPPDVSHVGHFKALQREAVDQSLGLWYSK